MVITSSTRNRVGGNTPRGFESHLLRQNKDHPSGWSLFFTEGGIRKAALSRVPVALCNRRGFSAEKESHRPDLSARFIRRDGRLWAECRWHSATAVGARRPTTSKIFNGCLPQQMESHRPDLSARSIRRERRLLAECRRHSATAVAFPQKRNPTFSAGRAGGIQTHLKNFPQSTKFFLRTANFLSCKSPQKPRKSSIFHRFYRQFTVFENFSNFFAIFVDKGGYP